LSNLVTARCCSIRFSRQFNWDAQQAVLDRQHYTYTLFHTNDNQNKSYTVHKHRQVTNTSPDAQPYAHPSIKPTKTITCFQAFCLIRNNSGAKYNPRIQTLDTLRHISPEQRSKCLKTQFHPVLPCTVLVS
jgi:hypothetical protein